MVLNLGPSEESSYRFLLEGFGVDVRQVQNWSLRGRYGCFCELVVLLARVPRMRAPDFWGLC